MLRPLLIALQFLTRLPLPKNILQEADYQPEQLGRSILMYPVVGLIIGGLLVLLLLLLQHFFTSQQEMISAAIILAAWVLLSGALHLDGLSDSADAWLGGQGDKERTLAIMKDPCCGPAGVTMLILVLLLKFAALTAILNQGWQALLITPLLARSSIPALFLTTPYVRETGIGKSHADYMPRRGAWLVLLFVFGSCIYLLRMNALWLLVFIVIIFVLLRYLMMNRIGGTTGDTAGAMLEIMETVVLIILSIGG